MAVFLRIVPLSAPFPACEIRFLVNNVPPGHLVFPDGASCEWTEPVTMLLSERVCILQRLGRCIIPGLNFPNRLSVGIQVQQNATLLSIPALPPPPPEQPTMGTVSTGCEMCRSGQALNIHTVVHNPTGETIVADYRPYGFTPALDEFLIEWASGVINLPPGHTVLPLTGEYTIPAEIPRGVYYFGSRLLHPASGRVLAEPGGGPYYRIEKID